ncbi:unnamed protein product [Malus baccata var. baccata]
MDNSWLTIPRNLEAYIARINLFLDQAVANGVGPNKFRCPYKRCCNRYTFVRNTVVEHLILYDMDKDYKNAWWRHHGEKNIGEQNVAIGEEETGDEVADMHDFLNDKKVLRHLLNPLFGKGVQKRLLEEADQDLWPGCKEFKKLEAFVRLYQVKCLVGMQDEIFTTLLELIKRMLPKGDCLPDSCYNAKKLINDLGLTYVKIDACPNDCMIYWKDTLELTVCSVVVNQDIKLPTQRIAQEKRSQLRLCGPCSPGKEIDVYMRPLIDGLNELWEVGTPTYDAYSNQSFTMKDAVLWTISDFPAYGMLSRWSTHVYKACPHCMHDKESIYLSTQLDVMHIEKNICDSVVGTLLDIEKSKDGLAARADLEILNIRQLSAIFKQLCSKKEFEEGFKQLNSRIALILCQLEKIFPPAFFDIMVHLPVHLADEAALVGPVQYRWMYPIEWYLQTLNRVDAQNQRGLWYNRKCQVCDLRLVASITSEDNFGLGQVRYKPYSRSPPSRRARRSAERGDRQSKQSNFQASNPGSEVRLRLPVDCSPFPCLSFSCQDKEKQMEKRCGQGQRQRQGESMIWDTLAFDPDDMRYSCSWCGLFAEGSWNFEILVPKLCQRYLTKLYVVPEELMVHVESGADEAEEAGASSISEIGPRGL